LGGSFDAEQVSNSWSEDISTPADSMRFGDNEDQADELDEEEEEERQRKSAIARYEGWCRDPNSGGLAVVENAMHGEKWITVESDDTQDFLEKQLKILEAFKAKQPEKGTDNAIARSTRHIDYGNDEKSISEHIGPVQFNMGGIQVDADDMLQRLKVSHGHHCFPIKGLIDKNRTATHIPHHLAMKRRKQIHLLQIWPRTLTMISYRVSLLV
jgi:dynein light intermediate chain 1